MKWKKVRIAVLNYNNIIKNFNSINMVCKYLIYKLVNSYCIKIYCTRSNFLKNLNLTQLNI